MTKEVISFLDVNRIQPNPFQPRQDFDSKKLEELAESIDTCGLLQPIIVREVINEAGGGMRYELVAGERRLRATRDILGKPRIKCIITKEVMTDQQSEEAALVENIQREDLNAMEQARALDTIMQREGLTQEQVAKRMGKSRADVSNLIRLLKLPKAVQDLVEAGRLERTKAWKIATVADPKRQESLAKHCVEHDWSFTKVRAEVDAAIQRGESPRIQRRVIRAEKPKVDLNQFILIKFTNAPDLNEFLACLIEQRYDCYTGADIMPALTTPTKPVDILTPVEKDDAIDLDQDPIADDD